MISSAMPSGINAWCLEHLQAMGKVERTAMESEDRRTQTIADLSELKGKIQDAKAGGDWGAASKALDGFMEKHAGDPDFKEINKALGEDKAQLDADVKLYNTDTSIKLPFGEQEINVKLSQAPASADANARLDGLLTKVDGLLGELTKGNEMGMLEIQESNSQENQVFQTASNLDASKSSAKQTSINNMRG